MEHREPFEQIGVQDVVLHDGESEILVELREPGDRTAPYKFHDHILEHEDFSMLGQITVARRPDGEHDHV